VQKLIFILALILGLAMATDGSEGSLKYNINGIRLGVHRSLVEKKFKQKSSQSIKSIESNLLEHFGSAPGYLGFTDGTWVRFDKQQLVVTVIGANLYTEDITVCSEGYEHLSAGRSLLRYCGKPYYSKFEKLKGTKFRLDYYRNSLMVKTQAQHPEYGRMFYLGEIQSEDP
jgi:hypothetical protein